MSLRRSRKISPIAIEEGTAHDGERGLGEGCSRESISIHDDRTPLVVDAEHAGNGQRSSAAEQQDATETTTIRPESRIGRRFMRYRNSWVGEDITLGTLRRVHARLDAVRSRITEEVDEGDDDDDDDDDDSVAAGNPEASPASSSNLALLAYFVWLSTSPVEEIDFQLMEQYIADGADVNAATETGSSIIHDVASNWDTTVAEFLFERGANIHAVNSSGQTPLHLAASTDHIEMVRWLLEKGAHLDAMTTEELQSPIHYAARNDSLEALQALIDKGGDYEIQDYKGRTPLHLAAELDRTVAAEYLLSLDPPAECRVTDKQGNHAITSMIRTMPQVAQLALDQLHRLAPAERKQFFLLSHLEPEIEKKTSYGIKTPFEMAVEKGQYSILSHPVMQELIRQKWSRCVRWSFYTLFSLYILFVLSWSLLIAYPAIQEKHRYVFPRDIWRIILIIVAIGTLIYQVVDEIFEVLRSRRKHRAYTKLRTRGLRDDLKHVDPSLPEEKKFLENELTSANRSPSNYFKDPWNIIDIICYFNLLILILTHTLDVAYHIELLALWTARLSCPAVILIWVRLLKYARAFHSIGPLIAIIGHLIGDILRYFVLYGIFLVPYVICFWVVFGGDRAAGLPYNFELTKVYRTAIMVFRMSLIDEYPFPLLSEIDELMTFILVITFLLIAGVVGLNLFIALLSDTFQRVYDNAQANALLQKAQLIRSYEEKVCPCIYERYLRYIHNNCNPCALYYDDDDTKKEEPAEIQKITHQIHNMVSELQMEREEESKKYSSGVEIMAARMARHEERMAAMDQTLTEIKTLLSGLQSATVINDSCEQHTPVRVPLAQQFPQAVRKLPPLNPGTRRGAGEHSHKLDRFQSDAAVLSGTSGEHQGTPRGRNCGLQSCNSSPGYLDCESISSCSSLTSPTHRRVIKTKKPRKIKWQHKH